MTVIHVALVNDYEVVVRGLAAMLRNYRDVIDVVELDANRNVAQHVDIALYDTFAGQQGDQDDVRELVANPRVGHVVVYSWVVDDDVIAATLAHGVDAYLSKEMPAGDLVTALEAVHRGDPTPHMTVHKDRVAVIAGDWPGREEGITQRESEVLALIVQGLSNTAIAAQTHVSINSVKTYIRNAYRRIGVTSRTQAVLWGIDHGFRPDRQRIRNPHQRLAE